MPKFSPAAGCGCCQSYPAWTTYHENVSHKLHYYIMRANQFVGVSLVVPEYGYFALVYDREEDGNYVYNTCSGLNCFTSGLYVEMHVNRLSNSVTGFCSGGWIKAAKIEKLYISGLNHVNNVQMESLLTYQSSPNTAMGVGYYDSSGTFSGCLSVTSGDSLSGFSVFPMVGAKLNSTNFIESGQYLKYFTDFGSSFYFQAGSTTPTDCNLSTNNMQRTSLYGYLISDNIGADDSTSYGTYSLFYSTSGITVVPEYDHTTLYTCGGGGVLFGCFGTVKGVISVSENSGVLSGAHITNNYLHVPLEAIAPLVTGIPSWSQSWDNLSAYGTFYSNIVKMSSTANIPYYGRPTWAPYAHFIDFHPSIISYFRPNVYSCADFIGHSGFADMPSSPYSIYYYNVPEKPVLGYVSINSFNNIRHYYHQKYKIYCNAFAVGSFDEVYQYNDTYNSAIGIGLLDNNSDRHILDRPVLDDYINLDTSVHWSDPFIYYPPISSNIIPGFFQNSHCYSWSGVGGYILNTGNVTSGIIFDDVGGLNYLNYCTTTFDNTPWPYQSNSITVNVSGASISSLMTIVTSGVPISDICV